MQGCGDGYSNNAPLCALAILHQVLLHPPTDALSVVYVPTNCEAHLTPLVGMIFVKWECSCTWIVLQASIWQAVFAQKRATNDVKCLHFRSLGRQPSATSNKADLNEISQPCRRSALEEASLPLRNVFG